MMQTRTTSVLAGALLAGFAATLVYAQGGRDTTIPDPALTPGAIASTDEAEVCGIVGALSYSKRHRQTTEALKDAVAATYGLASRRGYEIDHRVELSLGGADVAANLWPESYSGPCNAHDKDRLELETWKAVCKTHQMTLAEGQAVFLGDWREGYQRRFGTPCAAK